MPSTGPSSYVGGTARPSRRPPVVLAVAALVNRAARRVPLLADDYQELVSAEVDRRFSYSAMILDEGSDRVVGDR